METCVQNIDKIEYGNQHYELIASIVHDGETASTGHYVAYTIEKSGEVFKYNDNGGGAASYGVANKEFKTAKEKSYILLYKKRDYQ